MVILGDKGVSGIVKALLDISLFVGAIVWLGLPILLNWGFYTFLSTSGENYWFLLIILYVTGVFALIMIFELRKIFKTISVREPFVRQNAVSLRRIANMALLISGSYALKIMFFISWPTILLTVAFLIFGLSGLVFSELFRQAVEVKEDHDFTV